jgi:hypothetical protein
MAGHIAGPPPMPSTYFACDICSLARPVTVKSAAAGICVYCQQPSQASIAMELMWCIIGEHEVPRNGFTRPASGLESTEMCNPCYFQRSVASEPGRFAISSSPAGSRSNSPAPARVLDTTDPPIDFNMQNNDAEAPALSEQDWQYLKDFQARLAKDVILDHCTRCKETWFTNNVVDGVCKKCRTTRDKSKKDDEPFLMSVENLMDPGGVPPNLPELTQVEEMLIAKVHVMVEVHQIRGQQYRYSGHVCNFLRDVGKIYNKLPLLPQNLEIVLLKPANTAANPGLNRQFKKDYRVRRAAVTMWLEHLKRFHPGYADVEIDRATLAHLPEGGEVSDQFAVHEMPAVDEDIDVSNLQIDEEEEREVAAIPNLLAAHSELERMQRDAAPGGRDEVARDEVAHLTQAPFRATPLREFNRSQALLSLAFPTLFPYGEAEFVGSRVRSVKFAEYIEHLIKYHDGRFARHPRFRYVVFNTYMRLQVNKKST